MKEVLADTAQKHQIQRGNQQILGEFHLCSFDHVEWLNRVMLRARLGCRGGVALQRFVELRLSRVGRLR